VVIHHFVESKAHMRSNNLPQSNTAALPPPDSTLAMLPGPFGPAPVLSSPQSVLNQPSSLPADTSRNFAPSIQWRIPKNPGHCLADALNERWKQYCKQLRACRIKPSDRHVHQLRVASRRLSTHFLLVARVTGHDYANKAAKKLKRRLKMLGKLRDAQVLKVFLEEREKEFPEIGPMLAFLLRQERKLSKRIGCRILGFKKQKLEKWTSAICHELENSTRSPRMAELLGCSLFEAISAAHDDVLKCRARIDRANSQTIHRTRVMFKKFRYMLEAASTDFTGFGKAELGRLAAFQRRMGELQDAEVLQKFLAEFIEANPNASISLNAFRRYLTQWRAQKLRACLKHMHDLDGFMPAGAIHPAQAPRQAA
jgi:CHAD domain-containing protein